MKDADGKERRGARKLTQVELRLWRQVTKQASPLHRHMPQYEIAPAEPDASPALPPSPKLPEGFAFRQVTTSVPKSAVLRMGEYAGIDRNTAERFRRGRMTIDARLDLHGMTQEQAYLTLTAFLKHSHEKGRRCVLVITGKGTPRSPRHGAAAGILKAALPLWLNDPGIRPYLLVYDIAQPKDGGDGAFYLLLKRKRLKEESGS